MGEIRKLWPDIKSGGNIWGSGPVGSWLPTPPPAKKKPEREEKCVVLCMPGVYEPSNQHPRQLYCVQYFGTVQQRNNTDCERMSETVHFPQFPVHSHTTLRLWGSMNTSMYLLDPKWLGALEGNRACAATCHSSPL